MPSEGTRIRFGRMEAGPRAPGSLHCLNSRALFDTSDSTDDFVAKLSGIAADARLRRISMLAWRDLDDPEAGGSEIHASHIAKLWAEAGIEVNIRTSYAAGHPQVSW